MAWLCLKDDSLKDSQMCIVTGPRIDLAVGLIARLKMLFTEKTLVTFDTKETVIELNGVHIEAYPHITWTQCVKCQTHPSYC